MCPFQIWAHEDFREDSKVYLIEPLDHHIINFDRYINLNLECWKKWKEAVILLRGPGSEKMRSKSSVLLPAADRRTQLFIPIFSEPGSRGLADPCRWIGWCEELMTAIKGDPSAHGLGYVDSVLSQDNLRMRRNGCQHNLVCEQMVHPVL